MKYYISDLHLFHENAIHFDQRPFESVQQMHDTILKNWNDRVMNGDYVYIELAGQKRRPDCICCTPEGQKGADQGKS